MWQVTFVVTHVYAAQDDGVYSEVERGGFLGLFTAECINEKLEIVCTVGLCAVEIDVGVEERYGAQCELVAEERTELYFCCHSSCAEHGGIALVVDGNVGEYHTVEEPYLQVADFYFCVEFLGEGFLYSVGNSMLDWSEVDSQQQQKVDNENGAYCNA